MGFGGFLKQSTTVTLSLGPFLDDDDALTEKTGLTIADTTVFLSKNGGAKANPNDTNDCTEDANGVYLKQLDGTDTGTLGLLVVYVHESDALYIRQDYVVVTANVWNTLFSTDKFDVNIAEITAGIIANASFNADVGSTVYATNIIVLAARKVLDELNLDHLMKVAVANRATLAEVVDDTVLANLMTKTDGDTSDFDQTTDSLEALRDRGDAAWTGTAISVRGAGYIGDYKEDDVLYFIWYTSATPSVDGTIKVYRDDGTAEVTSPTGITDTRDFDSKTGVHHCVINLAANSFYTKERDYLVILSGATIGGGAVNTIIGTFSIENRYQGIVFEKDG